MQDNLNRSRLNADAGSYPFLITLPNNGDRPVAGILSGQSDRADPDIYLEFIACLNAPTNSASSSGEARNPSAKPLLATRSLIVNSGDSSLRSE